MNKPQRAVIVLAIALVVATGLFPPWVYVIHLPITGGVTRPAGFAWLFQHSEVAARNPSASPTRSPNPPLQGPGLAFPDSLDVNARYVDVRIDWDRLTVEWGVVLLASVGFCVLLRGKPGHQPSQGSGLGASLASFLEALGTRIHRPRVKRYHISELRRKPAPHWALDTLTDYRGDVDWAMEQADRNLGFNCFYVGPHEVLFGINFDEPDIPTWFPREHKGHALNREERLAWFSELLDFYGPIPKVWPSHLHIGIRQVRVLEALLHIYEAMVTGRLQDREGPGFTRDKPQSAQSSTGRVP